MSRIAGVDGCPGGWLWISLDTQTNTFQARIFHTAAELLAHDPLLDAMTIDMPIGLVSAGRRRCDELARDLLGNRHMCVSNAPLRSALYAPSRLAASAITLAATNREVGAHEWALYPKIINLDIVMTPAQQRWCFEIHPELSFHQWNNGAALQDSKDSAPGRQAREVLIEAQWPGARQTVIQQFVQQHVHANWYEPDDVNDAFAALWTAQRIASRIAQRIPIAPPIDARGLRMEMWY